MFYFESKVNLNENEPFVDGFKFAQRSYSFVIKEVLIQGTFFDCLEKEGSVKYDNIEYVRSI